MCQLNKECTALISNQKSDLAKQKIQEKEFSRCRFSNRNTRPIIEIKLYTLKSSLGSLHVSIFESNPTTVCLSLSNEVFLIRKKRPHYFVHASDETFFYSKYQLFSQNNLEITFVGWGKNAESYVCHKGHCKWFKEVLSYSQFIQNSWRK